MLSQNALSQKAHGDFKKDALLKSFFNKTAIYPHIDELQKIHLLWDGKIFKREENGTRDWESQRQGLLAKQGCGRWLQK